MKIKDIAALAQTSVATVSRVLNNDLHVSDAARIKVMRVVEETGYRPNKLGQNLRLQRTGKILAILPTILNQFYARIIEGLERQAHKAGYDVIIVVTYRDAEMERKYLKMLESREVDGAITFVSSLSDDGLGQVASQYPLVLCAGKCENRTVSYTSIDNEAAAYDGTRYLAELGNSAIAIINGRFGRSYEDARRAGYTSALKSLNIPYREEYVLETDYEYEDGFVAAEKLLSLPEPPTAIFAFSDTVAVGSMHGAVHCGLQPGSEIDIMGFDNILLSEMVTPQMTTVEQPQYDLGVMAFNLLYEKIQSPQSICKGVLLPHTIIPRKSTRSQKQK